MLLEVCFKGTCCALICSPVQSYYSFLAQRNGIAHQAIYQTFNHTVLEDYCGDQQSVPGDDGQLMGHNNSKVISLGRVVNGHWSCTRELSRQRENTFVVNYY